MTEKCTNTNNDVSNDDDDDDDHHHHHHPCGGDGGCRGGCVVVVVMMTMRMDFIKYYFSNGLMCPHVITLEEIGNQEYILSVQIMLSEQF